MTTDAGVVRHKVCPSCGDPFDCAAGGCWCDDVPLTGSMRTVLHENYADCLCPSCLDAVSDRANRDVNAPAVGHSDLLMIQFLRWVAERPRTYADVMEAWRSSCPRQSVWEDAQADGFVRLNDQVVTLTARGEAVLMSAVVKVIP